MLEQQKQESEFSEPFSVTENSIEREVSPDIKRSADNEVIFCALP